MSSPESMIPVPSTNLGPSGGEGSSRGQGKVKAQMVSGMTDCMLSDCTTLPGHAHAYSASLSVSQESDRIP